MKTCSKCGSENNDDVKYCSSCGVQITAIDETKRFCSQCGEEVPLGSNFCISCGAEVSPGRESIRPERAQAKAPKKRVAEIDAKRSRKGLVALIIAVPIISLMFYNIMQQPGSVISKRPTTPSGMPVPRGNDSPNEDAMAPVMQKLEELNERIEKNPDDFHAYLELGSMYATIGRFEEASGYFESYISLQPEDGRVRNALAEIYAESGDVEKAKTHLNAALTTDPNDNYALYNLGVILASDGDKDGAKDAWEKIIARDPDGELGEAAKKNLNNL